MIAAYLLASLAVPSRATALELGVTTLDWAAAEVGKQLGETLEVSNPWRGHPIFFSLRKASPAEAKAQLARLVHGRWAASGGRETLVPELKAVQAENRQGNPRWVSAMERMLREESQALDKEGAISDETVRDFEAKRKAEAEANIRAEKAAPDELSTEDALQVRPAFNAARHAVIPILMRIGAKSLSQISPGNRVVFSTRPTPTQKPLPSGMDRVLFGFVRDQLTVRRIRGAEDAAPVAMRTAGRSSFFGSLTTEFSGDPARPSEAFLAIYRSPSLGGFLCELAVGDNQGRGITEATTFLAVPGLSDAERVDWPSVKPGPLARELALVFGTGIASNPPQRRTVGTLPSEPGEEASLMVTGWAQGVGIPASETLRAALRKEDPWALLLNEPLSKLAESKDVAVLFPDTAIKSVSRASLSLQGLASTLGTLPDLEVTSGPDRLEIRPSSPSVVAQALVNRPDLREFLAEAAANRSPSLAAQSRIVAGTSGALGLATFGSALLQALEPSISQNAPPLSLDNQRWLRVWGTLTPELRKDSGSFSLTGANSTQMARLNDLWLNSVQSPVPTPTGTLDLAAELTGVVMPLFERERTRIAPRGAESTGRLAIVARRTTGYLGLEPSTGRRQFGGPEITGNRAQEGFFEAVTPTEFFEAQQLQVLIDFYPNPQGAATGLASEVTLTSPTALSFDQMPAEFRKNAAEARQRVIPNLKSGGVINPSPAPDIMPPK